MKGVLSSERLNMKLNFPLPSFSVPSCLKTPATTGTENTRHQDASPPSVFPPANKKPKKSFPSRLQQAFSKEKKKGLTDKPILLPRISFEAERHIAAVEQKAVENINQYLFDKGKNGVLTFAQLKDAMKDSLSGALQDMKRRFEQDIDQKNAIPGQSSNEFRASKEQVRKQAKIRIARSVVDTFGSQGWIPHQPETSNVKWELDKGPLLVKCGLSLQQLKLNRPNIANGNFGSVSIFENENGYQLIGKISKNAMRSNGNVVDDLAAELDAYKIIYDAVGPHPNLVNAYGIGQVPTPVVPVKGRRWPIGSGSKQVELKRTMLMDMVPGPTGDKAFDALRKCWDAGKLSSEEYWGAIQFVGRRMLDVTEHMGKAGVVHNDIKPKNFLVNEETGEPVLIDLGLWTERDSTRCRGTPRFMSPEAQYGEGVDERSDVFTVGASLLAGIEGDTPSYPNQGLAWQDAVSRDHEGNIVRQPGTYAAETAYTRFMEEVLKSDQDQRVNSEQAKKLGFLNHFNPKVIKFINDGIRDDAAAKEVLKALNHSMLDDDAAKEVIKKAISLARIEESKPEEKQWKFPEPEYSVSAKRKKEAKKDAKKAIDALKKNPNLPIYARVKRASKTNPDLKSFLDGEKLNRLQPQIEKNVAEIAGKFIDDAEWFVPLRIISDRVKMQTIQSGVDQDGDRKTEDKSNDANYVDYARSTLSRITQYAEVDVLRDYADAAEAFLYHVGTLKQINDPLTRDRIERVQWRAKAARHVVELDKVVQSADMKPEKINIQERASALGPELERLFEKRKTEQEAKDEAGGAL